MAGIAPRGSQASKGGEPELVAAGRLARACALLLTKLRFVIVLAWVAGVVAATIWLPALDETETAPLGSLIADDSDAVRAQLRSAELFEIPILSETAVVQRSAAGLTPDVQARVLERAVGATQNPTDGIELALPVTNTARLFPGSRENSTTAVTFLIFSPGTSFGDQRALAESYAAQVNRPDEHLIGVTGSIPARLEEADRIGDALPLIEIATVVLIAIIVGLTFRAVGAPLLTLVSAGLAYALALRVLPTVGDLLGARMPREIEPLVVVLLLGIVTDYTIFFLSGFRARLVAGDERLLGLRRATAQNLPIVVTAGLIVAVGAITLLAGKVEYFRALGPGLAVTAALGTLAATTLVPALLAIFGRAVFWPSRALAVPAQEQAPAAPAVVASAPERRPLRERIAFFATARPVAVLVVLVAGGALVVAASGLRDTSLGFSLIQGLPASSETRTAAEEAERGFAPGILGPTELLVEQPGLGTKTMALGRLESLLATQEGIAGVLGPREAPHEIERGTVVSEDGTAARMALILDDEPLGGDAIDRLRALDEAMPELLTQAGLNDASYSFAGDTAIAEDTVSLTIEDLRRIAIAALGVNLLFLVLFLRSLVAPLFLLATSVLALGATLGLTTYLFQGLLGHDELTYYVPFAAAVLLVSLGSDYNVFVVGRIWQEARRRPLREAIATAAPRASKTITIAGVTLAASFALLAIVPLRAFMELAFALAVGVLLEAFIVRPLLVPALISLFGEASWWPGGRRRFRTPGAPEPSADPLVEPGTLDSPSGRSRHTAAPEPGAVRSGGDAP